MADNKFDPNELKCGAYEIYWKAEYGGGMSVASVGRSSYGYVWMAPSNWVVGVPSFCDWGKVERVARLDHEDTTGRGAGGPSGANERQVAGTHYATEHGVQHWDLCAMFSLDHFQSAITKYVFRHKKKGGLQDLEKARHYLDKYIELEKTRIDGVHYLLPEEREDKLACGGVPTDNHMSHYINSVTCYLCRGYLTSITEEPDTILAALADDMGEFVQRLHGYMALAKKQGEDG